MLLMGVQRLLGRIQLHRERGHLHPKLGGLTALEPQPQQGDGQQSARAQASRLRSRESRSAIEAEASASEPPWITSSCGGALDMVSSG